jgi:hypothetical protein
MRIRRLNEAKDPFKDLRDYSINYIYESNSHVLDKIKITYIGSYKRYKKRETRWSGNLYEPGEPIVPTFSQYKKYLNNLFVNKQLIFVHFDNDKGTSFLVKTKIKGISIDKDGFIKKLKDDAREYIFDDRLETIDVEKYINLLKNLIGQNISFNKYLYRKNHKDVFVDDFQLKRIYQNKDGEIIFENEEGESCHVNIFDPICKRVIFTPEDPYGEEDWDINEDYEVDKNRLRQIKFIGGEELIDVITTGDVDFLNNNFTGWAKMYPELRTYIFHVINWEIDPNDKVRFTYDGYIHGESVKINIGPSNYVLKKTPELTITMFEEKEPTIMINEKDPYGEEDWSEYMENASYPDPDPLKMRHTNKSLRHSEISDIKKQKNVKILNDEFIGWIRILPELFDYFLHVVEWGISDGVLYTKYDGYVNGLKFVRNSSVYTYTLKDSEQMMITVVDDGDPLIRIDDMDPYGEEDWDYEVFEQFYDNDDDVYVPIKSKEEKMADIKRSLKKNTSEYQRFDQYLLFDRLGLERLEILRNFLIGKVIVVEQNNKKKTRTKGRVYEIRSRKVEDEQFYLIRMVTKEGEIELFIQGKDRFKVKSLNIPKVTIDPYGEEDWELIGDIPDEPKKEEKKKTTSKKRYFSKGKAWIADDAPMAIAKPKRV